MNCKTCGRAKPDASSTCANCGSNGSGYPLSQVVSDMRKDVGRALGKKPAPINYQEKSPASPERTSILAKSVSRSIPRRPAPARAKTTDQIMPRGVYRMGGPRIAAARG